MRVIICGAGRVGQGIARHLSVERHDITMVDEDGDLIDRVMTEFDVRGVVGHAGHPKTLRDAGADAADMLIAVTHFDEINMVICEIAQALFSVPTKVARVRSQAYLGADNSDIFSRQAIPIDLVISPEIEVGDAILRRIRSPGSISSISFEDDTLKLLGITVDADSPLVETALDQMAVLFPDLTARIVGVKRTGKVFAPRSNDHLIPGDTVYVSVLAKQSDRLLKLFNKSTEPLRRVVIVGGGNVGLYVARQLEKSGGARVRLIELDEKRADYAVSRLRQTIVINGDGLSREILHEAGVSTADIVVAVTNDDKTNMLLGKLAKQLGAKRAHTLVNSSELFAVSSDLDIDAVLDPRALSVSRILSKLRRGRILTIQSLEDGAAEIAEGIALASSPLIGKSVDYDDLPEGITVAAIIRGQQILSPSTNTRIQADDRILVFYESAMTRKVEQIFRVSADFF